MRRLARALVLYLAISFSGGFLLHGFIISLIFHSLVYGGASTGEQQFCAPRDGPDGDLMFDGGPDSCDIQIPYTALALFGGTMVTGLPLFLTMTILGLLATLFRSLPARWLSPFSDQRGVQPPWLSPLSGAMAACMFAVMALMVLSDALVLSVDYPLRYYFFMANFREEYAVVLFMLVPIWCGAAMLWRLRRFTRSILAKI